MLPLLPSLPSSLTVGAFPRFPFYVTVSLGFSFSFLQYSKTTRYMFFYFIFFIYNCCVFDRFVEAPFFKGQVALLNSTFFVNVRIFLCIAIVQIYEFLRLYIFLMVAVYVQAFCLPNGFWIGNFRTGWFFRITSFNSFCIFFLLKMLNFALWRLFFSYKLSDWNRDGC